MGCPFWSVVSDSRAKGRTPISTEALSFGASYPEEMEERTGTGEWITVCSLRPGGIGEDVASTKALNRETGRQRSAPTGESKEDGPHESRVMQLADVLI